MIVIEQESLKIYTCYRCPFFETRMGEKDYCKKVKRYRDGETFEIEEWCPFLK